MGLQPLYSKGPLPLLWAGSRAACGNITISGIRNLLNYCVIFIVYTQFTNASPGRIIQSGGPRVRDPWIICSWICIICIYVSTGASPGE
jgi:hypothetical protein